MIALLRYQAAVLFRSHRWIFPLIAYALLISLGGAGGQSLTPLLDWSAAMLVPIVALLTRSMLTAEPDSSRACVFAAASPARAQFATLIIAIACGAVLGLVGACYELVIGGHKEALLAPLLAGLGKAGICALVGSAVGTLFNPPLVRHPAAALLSTIAAVVVALVSNVSPASAALRGNGATVQSAAWPTGVPLLAALAIAAAAWGASCWLVGRRSE